jgi:hypothetical protein
LLRYRNLRTRRFGKVSGWTKRPRAKDDLRARPESYGLRARSTARSLPNSGCPSRRCHSGYAINPSLLHEFPRQSEPSASMRSTGSRCGANARSNGRPASGQRQQRSAGSRIGRCFSSVRPCTGPRVPRTSRTPGESVFSSSTAIRTSSTQADYRPEECRRVLSGLSEGECPGQCGALPAHRGLVVRYRRRRSRAEVGIECPLAIPGRLMAGLWLLVPPMGVRILPRELLCSDPPRGGTRFGPASGVWVSSYRPGPDGLSPVLTAS